MTPYQNPGTITTKWPNTIHSCDSMHPLTPFRFQVRRNVTDVSYHIAQYTNIIQELREEINRLRHRINNPTTSAGRKSHIADIQSVQCKPMRIRIKLRTPKIPWVNIIHTPIYSRCNVNRCASVSNYGRQNIPWLKSHSNADIQSDQCQPMRIYIRLRTQQL